MWDAVNSFAVNVTHSERKVQTHSRAGFGFPHHKAELT